MRLETELITLQNMVGCQHNFHLNPIFTHLCFKPFLGFEGFKNGKAACCGGGAYRGMNCGGGRNGTEPYELCSNPSEYVWFDGGHTTETANRQLAELIWSGAPNVSGPYNVKQLFGQE